MVFKQKTNKGGKPFQKTQQKKPVQKEMSMFDDLDDDDSDMDSDGDSDEVQKTPANKTPKGKQSLNEKRVSFQVQGNKTPGKTPNKQNTPAKKQNTPGKTNLKEFKGMKQNSKKNSQKDDDDEDEDDSDFEADLDLDLGDDDDDGDEEEEEDDDDDDDDDEEEDDDEDGDDDEDDDDDEDEEEENKGKKALKGQKQNNVQAKQKTPVKGAEKQNSATPKAQTPKGAVSLKKEQTPKTPKNAAPAPKDEAERRRQRDSKELYVGNLPGDVTPDELKNLSSDILSCVIPRLNQKLNKRYAFLQFESEEKVEENYNILKEKKFRGETLTVDYVGDKSLHRQTHQDKQVLYNLKKLYVSDLPIDCTIYQVAKFFPKASMIMFNQSPSFRCANVNFISEEDASEAFKAAKEIEIGGKKVSVLHSIMPKKEQRKKNNKRKRGPSHNKMNNMNNQKNKKMKFTPKKEDSDE